MGSHVVTMIKLLIFAFHLKYSFSWPTDTPTGILVVGGGDNLTTAEFWSPSPSLRCSFPDLNVPAESVNFVEDKIVACGSTSCDLFWGPLSQWIPLQPMLQKRDRGYTTAVVGNQLLLMGGISRYDDTFNETEIMPTNGRPS